MNLQEDTSTKVKWKQHVSDSFQIKQGVRQGGILSTEMYKRYNDTLLDQLEEAGHGLFLGTTHIPSPPCEDDIAFFATNPTDL